MKPKKKKSINQVISLKKKLTSLSYWQYALINRPKGNGILTIAVSLVFMGLYVSTPPPNNSLEQLNKAVQENVASHNAKCSRTKTKVSKASVSSGCSPTDKDLILKIYLSLLFLIALSYWIPLLKAQRNIVGTEDHTRLKYWCFVLSILIGFWFAFHIDPALGVLITIIFRLYFFEKFLPEDLPYFVEGRELMTHHQAKAFYRLFIRQGEETLLFGGIPISYLDASRSFLFLGRSGIGKSISISVLMQDILPQIAPDSGKRAILNDHNQSILPQLYGMDVNAPVHILNVFDARGVSWDMNKDFADPDELLQLAHILIPKKENKEDEFFQSAARICLFAICYLFSMTSPQNWQLRDLIIALSSREYLYSLLGNSPVPTVKRAIEVLGGGSKEKNEATKQMAGVMGTIVTLLDKYSTIASLSDYHNRCGRSTSLTEWSQGSSIIVLGNSNTAEEAIGVLNRAFIQRSCEIILDMPPAKTASNFLFLDEFPGLGFQAKIPKLALEGRKRGVCMILGIQSIADCIHIYGREKTHSLLGQIEHKAIFGLSDEMSTEWASYILGSQTTSSTNSLKNLKTEPLVPPSELLDIQVPNSTLEIGLKGWYSSKIVHSYTYPFSFIRKNILPPDETVPHFIPVDSQWKHLRPWNDDDIERLGIKELLQGKSSEKPIDYSKINDFFNRQNSESDMTNISDLSA